MCRCKAVHFCRVIVNIHFCPSGLLRPFEAKQKDSKTVTVNIVRSAGMEKILIVDDSLVQAAQLKSILEDEYDVTVAQRAEEGLAAARDGQFSLILLDVVMPGMDGFTLLKKLQEEIVTQSVPVILITSLSGVADEEHGLI